MKKVVFSVTRFCKSDSSKLSGLGYITDSDLIIACNSKSNKPYIRVFEDCLRHCSAIPDKPDEFKGSYYEIREIELDSNNGSKDTREVELNYSIWYKIVQEVYYEI